jgi:hypothetical protein
MSLSELRVELRALRKMHCPPVSRMKKTEIAMEVERLKGAKPTEVKLESEEEKKSRLMKKKEKNLGKPSGKQVLPMPIAPMSRSEKKFEEVVLPTSVKPSGEQARGSDAPKDKKVVKARVPVSPPAPISAPKAKKVVKARVPAEEVKSTKKSMKIDLSTRRSPEMSEKKA